MDASLPTAMSENLEEVWLISDLETASLRPNWEVGYAVVKQTIEANELAKSLSGYVDMIGDKKAVWTPRQSYLVPMSDTSLGFLRPADRALLAKWVNSESGNPIPPYLLNQAKQPESFLSLMVALNLANKFSPVDITKRVATFKMLANSDTVTIGKVLSSVQGVSIIVGRKSLNECIVSFEFELSPASLVPLAPQLLNEILNRNGTAAPEVLSWDAKVDGTKLSLQGPISPDSLDGILGIFSISEHAEGVSASLESQGAPQAGGPPSSTQVVAASQEYFGKVKAYIERVRKYEAQTTGYRAKWDEQQARRIDELPTLNVDKDLVTYGANVSNILRNNATSIRTGNVAAGQAQAAQAESFGYGYEGGYGYGGYYGNYYGRSQQSALRGAMVTGAQQRMGGFGSYREAIAAIDQATADIRRAMTDKYQVQF